MGIFKKGRKKIMRDDLELENPYDMGTEKHYDGLMMAMDNASDVATMRYVLLQFYNWFKSDFKELPLVNADPFTDMFCNGMTAAIYDKMEEITKKGKEAGDEEL